MSKVKGPRSGVGSWEPGAEPSRSHSHSLFPTPTEDFRLLTFDTFDVMSQSSKW
jgi:hypothetical protein